MIVKEVIIMITIIGSMNMDLVIESDKIPRKGETVFGEEFNTFPGGKGANQAVAAARLGGTVQMIATVGKDAFGLELKERLNKENIDTTHISVSEDSSTGIANIILSEQDNRIIVIPGANYDLTAEKILQLVESIKLSEIVIMQLEILPETVKAVVEICKEYSIPVLLDPAPAQYFDLTLIPDLTYMTPNEHECEQIFGMNFKKALEMHPNKLIVTLGKEGAVYFDGTNHVTVSAIATKVVDTTGAGDTFSGALGYALSNQYSLKDAILFANAASSLSVGKLGAQEGMPSRQQVEAYLAKLDRN